VLLRRFTSIKNFRVEMMKKLAVLALAISSASCAFAQSSKGAYVGFGLGASNIALNSSDFSYATSKKESSTGYRIYGGYAFNEYFAAEGGIADFGKATVSGGSITDESYEAGAVAAAAVGMLPFGDSGFSLLAKVGPTINVTIDTFTQSGTTYTNRKSVLSLYSAIGARYYITKNFALLAQYESFGNAGDSAQRSRSTLSMASLNLEYKF
jgi:OmpA-OmpF porin, OOP family